MAICRRPNAYDLLGKLVYKVLKHFIPELGILKSNISWGMIKSNNENSTINEHTIINNPFSIIDSTIGEYTYISINSRISNASIGKFCSIGPNFLCGWGIHPTDGISTSPMFYSTLKQNGISLSKKNKIDERKPIRIGNDVYIGANVIVLDGTTINDGAVIGAGAVVSKDIPPYAIAVGCPIKVIKYRFNQNQIDELLRIKWWEFSEDKLQDIERMFFDIDKFIEKYDS